MSDPREIIADMVRKTSNEYGEHVNVIANSIISALTAAGYVIVKADTVQQRKVDDHTYPLDYDMNNDGPWGYGKR